MNGIEALLEVLAAHGVRHIFGNPGSTELPLNEALVADGRFQYILGLHEVPLVSMADGFALASGDLGVATVHGCCGLGNAMGMLYNAHCEGAPILLLAGQQDRRLRAGDPVLAGDVVRVASAWTKWAWEVQEVVDLPGAVRRAVQTALTPPRGPVFLSLPVDLQRERIGLADLSAPCLPERGTRPAEEPLQRAARMLLEAARPVILAGSRVTEAGAVTELTRLAATLGAPVLTESTAAQGRRPMAADHPLYAGPVSMWAPEIHQRLAAFDVLLAVGADLFRLYIYREPSQPLPRALRLIHLDEDANAIGKNHPVELGLSGDLRAGLAALTELVEARQTAEQRRAASGRTAAHAEQRQTARARFHADLAAASAQRPMVAATFVEALCRPLPRNVAVVEEAVSTHTSLLEKLGVPADPTGYFAHRGWALGWGLGCALGVKLAWPERPVVALLGDGSALFGIQGLWTAAHYDIPVVFVIANNAQYGILKMGGQVMGLPRMTAGQHVGLDLTDPQVDFVSLAQAFGVAAARVSEPDELSERMRAALASGKPQLLDVAIAR